MNYALDLLFERNCRMEEGCFRNSISLAMAVVALPFVEAALDRAPGTLWESSQESDAVIDEIVDTIFLPQNMMVRMREAACRILRLLPFMEKRENHMLRRIYSSRSYGHARELLLIRQAVAGKPLEECEALWPDSVPERGPRVRRNRGRR
jgi:poly(A) polymerase